MLTIQDQFNLLLSCRRFREVESCQELHRLLGEETELGSVEWCKATGISGLIVARVEGDPHAFVARLSQFVKRSPWSLQELLKVVPIDVVVETSLEAIGGAASQLASRMPKGSLFRVTLHRRNTTLEREEILHKVATQFPGKVDLENYEYICIVEVLGPVTGLALIREGEILTMRRP